MTAQKSPVLPLALLVGIAILAGCATSSASNKAPAATGTATTSISAATPYTQPTAPATVAASTTAEANATETETGYEEPNCGGPNCGQPGPAITQNLKGNVDNGKQVFADKCQSCHGPEGKQGIANPGSEDGVVPTLNPVDKMFNTNDTAEFKRELDLFIEHGSHTGGSEQMPAWGDSQQLTPQQIADVIAYIVSLNSGH